jgi:hypothetical protein
VFKEKNSRTTFSNKLFLIGCSCTLLFDLYHPVLGKIFDIFGFLFIFIALAFNKNFYTIKLQLYKENLIWGLPMLMVGLLSIFISPISAIAIILGLLILLTISFYFENEIVNKAVIFLTISQKILLLTQLLQLIVWSFTGYSIDYGEFLGFNTSRNFDGAFFRASGILAEANGMTVTQSLLYITLLKYRRKNIDMLLFLISIFITFSLQGALIGLITLFAFFFTNTSKEKLFLKILVFLFLIIIFLSSTFEYISTAYQLFLFRLDKFDNDQSLYYRLLKPITIPFFNLLHPHFYDILEAVEYGPGNAYFTGLYFFGIFFFFFLWSSIRKFYGNGYLPIIILLITLLSYQVYTTALFWVMLSFAEAKDRYDKRTRII